MPNIIKIEMQREFPAVVSNGEIIECESSKSYDVYACSNEIKTWIGNCTDIESLKKIAGPEYLIESINQSASEAELNILLTVLSLRDNQYDFFGQIKTAIEYEV